MDSFEYNKIAAAILIALLVGAVANQISKIVIDPKIETAKAYLVQAPADTVLVPLEQAKLPEIAPLLAKADIQNGEKIFKKCMVCHNIGKGQAHKTGPTLWNVVLAPIAKMAAYPYSSALKSKEGTWTYENLNIYLHSPRQFAQGTKMTFVGLPNDQERADVIAYLRQHADNPAPLP